ncbi:septal ring lytic transglycosylase RlpA family protein [Micromonospora sp. 4G55]|uniref:septal ring lytic transglycosylase RlpA family protein n=1 Tax=Micromonospora sp. 4G55 TaxID=2806102 RepID=UPI001EE4EAEF|nr:septal ring lytic transglycosylase RlpA family protein [Micromonospora sp. 4G55]
MQRKHVLAAGVAVVAAAVVAVGTGFGFADTTPAGQSACQGSVTFSAEGGAPAATSDRFPVGTRLRVTNLDNNRAATVTVTGPSGSCVLLNAAAMELVREPGKNVIRRNLVERLDGAAARPGGAAQPGGQTRPGNAQPPAQPGGAPAASVCAGAITFSAEGGAPAATSGQFPVGTRLRVTNLDNSKVVTVTVTGPSGSCVLLNAAAMDAIREPGKNLVRRNVVELLR